MANKAYRLSFTSGGLLLVEAVKVAGLYLALNDWTIVRRTVLTNNLFQSRTQASSSRTFRELRGRLQVLSIDQLNLLASGLPEEQLQILWIGVTKQYPFVRDFMIEVVREKYLRFERQLSYLDFDAFYNAKAEWQEALNRITDRTRTELRRSLFQMLREAGVLSKTNQILPIMLSARVMRSIVAVDPAYLAVFPSFDGIIQNQDPR